MHHSFDMGCTTSQSGADLLLDALVDLRSQVGFSLLSVALHGLIIGLTTATLGNCRPITRHVEVLHILGIVLNAVTLILLVQHFSHLLLLGITLLLPNLVVQL